MSETCWAIKEWDQVFENFRTREIERLEFVRWPLDRKSEACAILMQTEKGIFAFGVFARLVEVAAHCPVRGVLCDEKGPLTAVRLSVRTQISAKLVEKAIYTLSGPDIGWILKVPIPSIAHRPRIDEGIDRRIDGASTDDGDTRARARARNQTKLNLTQPGASTEPNGAAALLKSLGVGKTSRDQLVAAGVTVAMIEKHRGKSPGVIVRALQDDLADAAEVKAGTDAVAVFLDSRTAEELEAIDADAKRGYPADSPFQTNGRIRETKAWKNAVARAMAAPDVLTRRGGAAQ